MIKLPDTENFNFKDCVIGGDECWLITPKDMGCEWSEENARFRSCIVRKSDHYVISQGFRKFMNWGEKPEFENWDESWNFEARHKLDGSLLLVSRYKGEWIIRTRGTVDARQLPNGHEIDILMKKYDKFFNGFNIWFDGKGEPVSALFEWTTNTNVIVLREHEEPTLTLVGMVWNDDATYINQVTLDLWGRMWGINRPEKYEYESVADCLADVAAWSGKEGVVLYSPNGNILKKIKSEEYKELHKVRTGVVGINQVMDIFITSPRFTTYSDFFHYIETTVDFEVATKCSGLIERVVGAYNNYLCEVDKIRQFLDKIKGLTKKEQAFDIVSHYKGWRQSVAFMTVSCKEIETKLFRNALKELIDEN